MKCSGKRCPIQYPYEVEKCQVEDCPYRTEDPELTDEQKKKLSEVREDFKKASESIAKSLLMIKKAYDDAMNGTYEPEPPKLKINRCQDCVFRTDYHDMGATMPVCTFEHYELTQAIREAEAQEPCKHKLTYAEAREYAKNRKDRWKNESKDEN